MLAAAVQRVRPDALLADLGTEPLEVLPYVEKLPTPRPRLIVIGPDDSGTILRAMRMGVRDYFDARRRREDDYCAALERLVRERQGGEAGAETAPWWR